MANVKHDDHGQDTSVHCGFLSLCKHITQDSSFLVLKEMLHIFLSHTTGGKFSSGAANRINLSMIILYEQQVSGT